MRKATLILMILLLLQTALSAETYIKGVIWLKVKPEYRGAEADKNTALFACISGLKVKTFGRKFPKHEPPREKLSPDGQVLADLSLMYELVLQDGADENEAITKLLRTQQLEYAERKRYYEPLYMPNDPAAQSTGDLYAILNLVRAYQAWDVYQGDSTVSIAVLDTGVEWAIPELGNNIKLNLADPINGGIDDDGNGYADDYRGWDMANNDNDPTPVNPHGTNVSGIAAARGNNAVGVVGLGLKCKLWPVKVYATDNSGTFGGFEGIVYAADMGCKAINMSWGNVYTPSLAEQEIVNYAALNKNVVVVAAGGNTPAELDFYPASYRNILSVVHTDVADQRNPYATYSRNIDMTAPGASVYGVTAGGVFTNIGGGSSFASPMVAAAAALLYSANPSFSAQQIAELLRVNTDNIDQVPANVPYATKMGTGRLNMYKAITKTYNTSVRVVNQKLTVQNAGLVIVPDTAKLVLTFTNYLNAVSNVTVSVSTESSYITMLSETFTINSLATLASLSNTATPFKFLLASNIPANTDIWFTVKFQGNNYSDYQHIKVNLNTTYANLDLNQITTSIGSNGRLGYVDDNSQKGRGMRWGNYNFIYECGLMIGYSPNKVSNAVRGINGKENDFRQLRNITFDVNNNTQQKTSVILADSAAVSPLNVRVKQIAYEYKQAPQDKNFIVEYEVQNLSNQTYDSLHIGLFTDFDIMLPDNNRTEWNNDLNLGYSYALAANTPYVGVQLLSPQEPSFYAIDNINAVDSNNIYMVDEFSDQEKYITLSRGVYRQHAGFIRPNGSDILQVNGAKLRHFLPNEKRKVAFAFVVGSNYNDLKSSALQIKANFKIRNMSPLPSVANLAVCQPYNVWVLPTNGSKFRFYADASLNTLLHEGAYYNIVFTGDSTKLYVTCADSLFESYAQPITVRWDKANGQIGANPSILNLAFHNTATFTDQTAQTQSRTWDFGAGFAQTQTQVTRTFSQIGTYPVRMAVQNMTGCVDTVTVNYQVINDITATNQSIESWVKIYPNPNTGTFTLALPHNAAQLFQWTVYDLQGKEIIKGLGKHEQEQILLPTLPEGCYYMRVYGDKIQKTLKLYIQH